MWENTHVILKLCGKCFYLEIFFCIINVTEGLTHPEKFVLKIFVF